MNAMARTVLGYLVSVITAAAATASILSGHESTSIGTMVFLMIFGSAYIITCGLPGFALTVYAARKYKMHGLVYFALAGGLNAIIAWTILYLATGSSVGTQEPLFIASIVGGIAGGIAYWSIAVRTSSSVLKSA